MLISEIIVGLWFLPVVLFILVPLAMFSAWLLYRIIGAIFLKVQLAQSQVKQAKRGDYSSMQTRPAA
jgi:hypothetical protein